MVRDEEGREVELGDERPGRVPREEGQRGDHGEDGRVRDVHCRVLVLREQP